MIKIFLMEDKAEAAPLIRHVLESNLKAKVEACSSLQLAIELLENKKIHTDLIICDYHGKSVTLLVCLLELCPEIPVIFIHGENEKTDLLYGVERSSPPEFVSRKSITKDLDLKVRELLGPKLAHLLPTESLEAVAKQTETIDRLLESPTVSPADVHQVADSTLALIHNLVEKVGFTAEVQALATKSVEMSLKLIGNKPRLQSITENLKLHEGKYLSSHSIMIAELSCAIAYKVGWHSASTFFKLALASFLHDMPLKDNLIAQCKSLEQAKVVCNENLKELALYKLHPSKAADFARAFNEIPPDVDTIVLQHHERPDGTGFPRELFHNQIAPLSSLFIIAHDLMHYLIEKGDRASIDQFVEDRADQYQHGVFKKVMRALLTD